MFDALHSNLPNRYTCSTSLQIPTLSDQKIGPIVVCTQHQAYNLDSKEKPWIRNQLVQEPESTPRTFDGNKYISDLEERRCQQLTRLIPSLYLKIETFSVLSIWKLETLVVQT